jgi:hypothetical protein
VLELADLVELVLEGPNVLKFVFDTVVDVVMVAFVAKELVVDRSSAERALAAPSRSPIVAAEKGFYVEK